MPKPKKTYAVIFFGLTFLKVITDESLVPEKIQYINPIIKKLTNIIVPCKSSVITE